MSALDAPWVTTLSEKIGGLAPAVSRAVTNAKGVSATKIARTILCCWDGRVH